MFTTNQKTVLSKHIQRGMKHERRENINIKHTVYSYLFPRNEVGLGSNL